MIKRIAWFSEEEIKARITKLMQGQRREKVEQADGIEGREANVSDQIRSQRGPPMLGNYTTEVSE